ncbi:hypothetical protein FIBSPDRAFT_57578 [Athelia psychrophila]|uniref:Uncharacterized protein n=1 Tax=Athelia psychrophila TaxID=1759441 RepID=A0A166FCG0_9AGAM|nr:hypothetical protein FIBSPDRAFT_57578 [Fibularhizoctonia sp. CBS 109695]
MALTSYCQATIAQQRRTARPWPLCANAHGSPCARRSMSRLLMMPSSASCVATLKSDSATTSTVLCACGNLRIISMASSRKPETRLSSCSNCTPKSLPWIIHMRTFCPRTQRRSYHQTRCSTLTPRSPSSRRRRNVTSPPGSTTAPMCTTSMPDTTRW